MYESLLELLADLIILIYLFIEKIPTSIICFETEKMVLPNPQLYFNQIQNV